MKFWQKKIEFEALERDYPNRQLCRNDCYHDNLNDDGNRQRSSDSTDYMIYLVGAHNCSEDFEEVAIQQDKAKRRFGTMVLLRARPKIIVE